MQRELRTDTVHLLLQLLGLGVQLLGHRRRARRVMLHARELRRVVLQLLLEVLRLGLKSFGLLRGHECAVSGLLSQLLRALLLLLVDFHLLGQEHGALRGLHALALRRACVLLGFSGQLLLLLHLRGPDFLEPL